MQNYCTISPPRYSLFRFLPVLFVLICVYVHVCACVCVFGSIWFYHMCRFPYLALKSKPWAIPSQGPFMLRFYKHIYFPTHHTFCPWSVLLVSSSVTSRTTNGIRLSVTFWDWLSSLDTVLLRFIQVALCISSSLLCLASSGVWYGFPTVCLTCLLKDLWAVSNFWLLQIRMLWPFGYRFLCAYKVFVFLG